MKIKSDLGTGDQIMLRKTLIGQLPEQKIINLKCPYCNNTIEVPLKGYIMNYKSLYEESEDRLRETIDLCSKLTKKCKLLEDRLELCHK